MLHKIIQTLFSFSERCWAKCLASAWSVVCDSTFLSMPHIHNTAVLYQGRLEFSSGSDKEKIENNDQDFVHETATP